MSVESEFFVEDTAVDKKGELVFVGFPNKGRSVKVGDRFSVSYQIPRALDDILSERPVADPINRRNISLVITAIDCMRNKVNELPLGVTGALYLDGEGAEYVTKRSFLRTSDVE